jgi:RNA polymerase sigma-70 factor (ECF subfamily)
MMTERAPHQLHSDAITDDPPMDDVALLAGVASGDSRALRHLYERHAGWIAGRLRLKMPPHAVEDVLQETFLAVWRGAGRYGRSGDVGGWIWGIARRQMALWYRKRGQEPVGMVEEWVPDTRDISQEVTGRIDLDRAFDQLGDSGNEDRQLAEAYFLEDRPMRELAERFGIPTGTVKSRLFRIRRRLIAALEREPGQ